MSALSQSPHARRRSSAKISFPIVAPISSLDLLSAAGASSATRAQKGTEATDMALVAASILTNVNSMRRPALSLPQTHVVSGSARTCLPSRRVATLMGMRSWVSTVSDSKLVVSASFATMQPGSAMTSTSASQVRALQKQIASTSSVAIRATSVPIAQRATKRMQPVLQCSAFLRTASCVACAVSAGSRSRLLRNRCVC